MHHDFDGMFGDSHDVGHHDTHLHDEADTDGHTLHEWHDGYVNHGQHLHLEHHSEATDSNHDGISDAASKDMGLNPFNVNAHHTVNLDWHDNDGHIHHTNGKDSDHDGWPDDLERLAGTNPYDAASHPSLVEAHHYPAGSDENLPGTVDVTPQYQPWP